MSLKSSTFRIENIQPILNVKDIAVSISFYVDILGFKAARWGMEKFTSVNRDNTGIYLCQGAQGGPGTWIWIGFDGDLHAFHQELVSKGVKIKQAPISFSWALEMEIEDPDGHVLRIGTDPEPDKPYVDTSGS
jgi:catechol 2,3-dioxygenase-like lactoylglutathione lyase family enzyme